MPPFRAGDVDRRFVAAARRWPALMTVLFERPGEQLHDAQRRAAIVGLPRVEQRLLGFFWQLADRWGVMRPDGIVIRLKLTHELLGHVVAARRSTVTLAIAALAADNLLRRDAGDQWTLAHHSVDEVRVALGHGSDAMPGALAGDAAPSIWIAPPSRVDQATNG
jgi:hypothetical protein